MSTLQMDFTIGAGSYSLSVHSSSSILISSLLAFSAVSLESSVSLTEFALALSSLTLASTAASFLGASSAVPFLDASPAVYFLGASSALTCLAAARLA